MASELRDAYRNIRSVRFTPPVCASALRYALARMTLWGVSATLEKFR